MATCRVFRSLILGVFAVAFTAFSAGFDRGVNLSGAEFGADRLPGVIGQSHTYQSEGSFRYFAGKKLKLIRLPFQWERLQPQVNRPLDPDNLTELKRDAEWAQKAGCKLIIEPHNYGRRKILENGKWTEFILDQSVSNTVKLPHDALDDLWRRLSAEFKDNPGVYAYDLMNEPHDMGNANWKVISQAALTAIRNQGDRKLILVPGYGWSSAKDWPKNNGATNWIHDPLDNFKYEAHCYFDRDNSGTYKKSYEEELAADANLPTRGSTRLMTFVDWCRNNNVQGFLGEYGAPNNDPRWSSIVLEDFLAALDRAQMDGTYWAAGEFWGKYPLSVQPGEHFTQDAPQMETLLRHLGK